MGDLNTTIGSRTYRRLTSKLRDAYHSVQRPSRRHNWATFPTRYPALRLDYILVGPSVEVLDLEAVSSPLARFASDHLPVIAELSIGEQAADELNRVRPRALSSENQYGRNGIAAV